MAGQVAPRFGLSLSNRGVTTALRARHAARYAVRHFYTRQSVATRLRDAGLELFRAEYVLTTPVSLALARFTYRTDDVGRYPGGWAVKYPALALASTLGFAVSRISERVAGRREEGLTLIVEARKPAQR